MFSFIVGSMLRENVVCCCVKTKQEFEDARDADDAVYDLNGKLLCGERYGNGNCIT